MRFSNDDIFVGGVDRDMLVAHEYVTAANMAGFDVRGALREAKQRVVGEIRHQSNKGKAKLQSALNTPEGTKEVAVVPPVNPVVNPMAKYILPVGLGIAAVAAIWYFTKRKGR